MRKDDGTTTDWYKIHFLYEGTGVDVGIQKYDANEVGKQLWEQCQAEQEAKVMEYLYLEKRKESQSMGRWSEVPFLMVGAILTFILIGLMSLLFQG